MQRRVRKHFSGFRADSAHCSSARPLRVLRIESSYRSVVKTQSKAGQSDTEIAANMNTSVNKVAASSSPMTERNKSTLIPQKDTEAKPAFSIFCSD
jgi:hypothetical protein